MRLMEGSEWTELSPNDGRLLMQLAELDLPFRFDRVIMMSSRIF